MDGVFQKALAEDRLIDITTTGRKTGGPRKIEITFFVLEGSVYITGRPGRPRSWYANMRANPDFTFHIKQSAELDLAARATPVLDESSRRAVFEKVFERLPEGTEADIDEWMNRSPLVEVEFSG